MSNKKKRSPVNVKLPEDLRKRLDAYILKIAKYRGHIPFGIQTTISIRALEEYLDKHENDETIDYSRPTGNRKS